MEIVVINLSRSIAYDEVDAQNEVELNLIVKSRTVTINHGSLKEQPLPEVVRIKGCITVSF